MCRDSGKGRRGGDCGADAAYLRSSLLLVHDRMLLLHFNMVYAWLKEVAGVSAAGSNDRHGKTAATTTGIRSSSLTKTSMFHLGKFRRQTRYHSFRMIYALGPESSRAQCSNFQTHHQLTPKSFASSNVLAQLAPHAQTRPTPTSFPPCWQLYCCSPRPVYSSISKSPVTGSRRISLPSLSSFQTAGEADRDTEAERDSDARSGNRFDPKAMLSSYCDCWLGVEPREPELELDEALRGTSDVAVSGLLERICLTRAVAAASTSAVVRAPENGVDERDCGEGAGVGRRNC